jgi:DNA-binding Lrp family transcriptional regulator
MALKRRSTLTVRWPVHGKLNGEMSYFIELIGELFKNDLTDEKIDKWLKENLNDNRRVANILERKIIEEFKFFIPEMRFGDKPFIDYIYFLKWERSPEIIKPLIEKIIELEKVRLSLYYEVTHMEEKEWVEVRGKLLKDTKKFFDNYVEKYLDIIKEYEKGINEYRKNLAEGKFI